MSKTVPAAPPQTVMFDDLTAKQSRFVCEFVERGGKPGDAADAAVAAGYARPGHAGRAAARSRAHELLRTPAVLKALHEERARRLSAGAVLGVRTLMDLCQNARSEQVRLSAAKELVDRGHGPVVSRNASLNVTTTIEDVLDQLDAQEKQRAAAAAGQTIDVAPVPRIDGDEQC
ncbi:MAG: terminase small subunit [Alphaproteobacteria bacterium]|nr:terminase small subunit [Alphaproteobacteria bacterium]